ncbi:LysR family transcriptional regulator [Nocardioides KLBMP 9356]|uniref:LysR family transcriptional regulator n=1 Tax=Nocardioides potassii TaxID=2911371 RepID=A0ABS9H848_9ACTN|nr:LysR family transcriptional regulator [Nocardioides potassii]MCF6376370.1 LysR family transcriptional regulator [Nocardioides potassii]
MLRDLEWLVALAELGHVTEAAAVIGTSQPTLSRALARLEGDLGVRLFERVPTGLVLTPDGDVVLEAARELVGRHDLLRATLANRLDPETGLVRLAFLDSMATTLVPRLLRAFHEHAPGVKVVLSQEPAHEIRRDLDRGAVELGLTMEHAPEHGWFAVQRERLVVIVPPTHRLGGRRRVDLAELADDELVTTPPGFGHSALVQGLLAEAGVAPRTSFESADLATIEGLVAAGLGFAVVPEAFAGLSGTVGLSLSSPGATRTIGLTWRTDRPLAPPARRLLDLVRSGVWAD